MAERMGDRDWGALLQQFHAVGQRHLERYRGELVDTAGDGMFAVFDGPARAIQCASAITREVRGLGIDLRVGLHTGEVESAGDKVSGVAVHIGARVMAHAGSGEIIVSGTTKDLVAGSGLDFADRGIHALKGVAGEWRLFQALNA
jgi:class 3 adenylate cyclase